MRHTAELEHHLAIPAPGGPDLGSGAVYDADAIAQLTEQGISLHWLPLRRRPYHPANGAAMVRLRRLVGRLRPDVVHGHTSIGGAVARLACIGTDVPVLYTPHALVHNRFYLGVERGLGRWTSGVVAVSPSEAVEIRAARLVAPERVAVVPNGVSLDPPPPGEDLRTRLGLPCDAELVGTAIRLVEQKAPLDFVAACRHIAADRPECHFLLIGSGPLQSAVDRAVAAAGLSDRWHQVHHLPDAAAAIGQLDVFVLASHFEGGPYTPLEAMRARVPVVLTDVAGNRDVVENAVSGVLVPAGSGPGIAEAVSRLLDDEAYRKALVDSAVQRLSDIFDARSMADRYRLLYSELADEGRRSTRKLPQPSASSSTNRPDRTASR